MTYPPNQPGPYGQGPYGHQQPGDQYGQTGQLGQPYGQQPGFSGGEPPKSKGPMLAVVATAVLVLAVVGFLLIDGDESSNGGSKDPTRRSEEPPPDDEDPMPQQEPTGETTGGNDAGVSEEEMLETAQSYVDAVNARDEQAAMQYHCDTTPGALYEAIVTVGRPDTMVSIIDVHESGDTSGSVNVMIGDPAYQDEVPPPPLPLIVQDGSWCVQY